MLSLECESDLVWADRRACGRRRFAECSGDIKQDPSGDQRWNRRSVVGKRAEVPKVVLRGAPTEPVIILAAGRVRQRVDRVPMCALPCRSSLWIPKLTPLERPVPVTLDARSPGCAVSKDLEWRVTAPLGHRGYSSQSSAYVRPVLMSATA